MRQLAAAVDVEIGVRIPHAVDVADLSGEVEDHLAAPHQVVHRRALAHVGDVDAQAVFDAGDVEEVAAVVGQQRIDDQDVGAELDQRARQVDADEAEPAGDEDAAPAIELAVVLVMAGSTSMVATSRTVTCQQLGQSRQAARRARRVVARGRRRLRAARRRVPSRTARDHQRPRRLSQSRPQLRIAQQHGSRRPAQARSRSATSRR